MFSLEKKINLIKIFSFHTYDCGSSPIQIILLSFKIFNSINHLKYNNKDYSCKRKLTILINKKKKLLLYLKKKNKFIYLKLIKDLL